MKTYWSIVRQSLVSLSHQEWLQDRRKLEKNWVDSLKASHIKLEELVKKAKEKNYPSVNDWLKEKENDKGGLSFIGVYLFSEVNS